MNIQEVARRAEVSTATVSRVMNGSPSVKAGTFERVKKIIDELQYVPNTSARSLRAGKSYLYGLIVSDINNPFFPELIDDFEARAREEGIDVVFSHTNYQPDRLEHCLRRLIERGVDGIAVCTSETNPEAFAFAETHKRPFVLMGQEGPDTAYSNIPIDHLPGMQQAIEHLHELGHRDIGFVAGPNTFDSTVRRRECFYEAMKAFGLPVRHDWVIEGDMHLQGGESAMAQLLDMTARPTALLCSNDLMAFGALRAAHQRGLSIPEDLSIIGFDNLPVCDMMTPPLSSIDIPRRQIAAQAFSVLRTGLKGKAGRKQQATIIPTTLVLRSSTAAPSVKR